MANEKKSLRETQIEARRKLMAELNPPLERVRVTPANDELRRVLKHPKGNKFPESGSTEWPLDQFTRRRIKDGSVKRESERRAQSTPKPAAAAQPAPPAHEPPKPAA
jgi:hypothetical protein